MIVEVDQLTLMRRQKKHIGFLITTTHESDIYRLMYPENKLLVIYCLFAGQKVFADTEEVLPVLPEAFNEAFL